MPDTADIVLHTYDGARQQERTRKGAVVKKKARKIAFDHSGSSCDDFLEEEGIREEVEAVAIKRVLAWQLSQEMQRQKKTKQAMARDLQTSRSQLDRLLDPRNVSVSLDTMARAARVLGKSLVIRIGDRKPGVAKHRGAAIRSKEQPARRAHRHGTEIEL